MAKWRNPLAEAKPATVGLFLLVCLWAVFQWRDPTPPPVLDQILVASFGIWFAAEAVDKKGGSKKKANDDDDEEDDDDGAEAG